MSVKYEHSDQRKSPLISIIIPVYNLFCYIEECITSIQKQTYDNIEIIIVDDGSTDNSGDLCEKIAEKDERIQVIKQENMGVVAARGAGIEASSGEYISFVDGDDWIEPDMIETMVNLMNNGVDMVSAGFYRQFTPNRIIKINDRFSEGLYTEEKQIRAILGKVLYDQESETFHLLAPSCWNKLFRADLVKKIYREIATEIIYAEDVIFFYKYLIRCQSLAITYKYLYHYRYRGSSAVHTVNTHMLMDINKVYLALKKDFQGHVLGKQLLYQLEKWVSFISCKALSEHMGFDSRIHIPEFIADLSDLKGKRLILYGAGSAGKDTYFQLNKFGYQILLWVDKDYKYYRSSGLPVVSPDEILVQEYDVIFIAVQDNILAEKIKSELLRKGILEGKLVWRKPVRVF